MRMDMKPHPAQLFGDGADIPTASVLAAADTGANTTMIRRSVAEELGLIPIREVTVHHFAGPAATFEYPSMLGCPECGTWRPIVMVDDGGAEHPQNIDFPELLIGRDLLQYAHLELDGLNGEWSFEFDFDHWPKDL